MRLPKYRFGPFELDAASRELTREGNRVALPPKSFECLAYLIAHRDRAVGRDELIAAVWGRVEVSDAVVAQTLLRARKALDDSKQASIRTVSRFGYQWIAPVQVVPAAGEAVPAIDAPAEFREPDVNTVPLSQPATASPPRRWPWLAGIALLAAVAVAVFHFRPTSAPVTQRVAVLVLPVSVEPADGDNAWVRLGAMDYIASRLRSSGMTVLPSDQAMHLYKQVGDRGPLLDATDLQKLTKASGAGVIVLPEAIRDGTGWRLRLNLHDASGPRAIDAHASTPLAAAAAATDSWLRRLGRLRKGGDSSPSPLAERVQQIDAELITGQLDAVRRLIEAAPANERDDPLLRVREGQLEYRAGHMDLAAGLFQRVLDGKPVVTADVRAKALMGQGAIAIRRGDYVAAEASYGQALALLETSSKRVDDPALLGNAYNGRGVARVKQGKMEGAINDMGMARIAMQRSGSVVEAATVGSNLGNIELERGHATQALQEFDRAIAVFERFEVRDYLAVALAQKASTELKMAQPANAAVTVQRADELRKSLEDPYLAARIATIRAHVMLATGRLGEVEKSLSALDALALPEAAQDSQELTIQWRMARGDGAQAGMLAQQMPDATHAVHGSLALAAVQAALRNHDLKTARAWMARWPGSKETDMPWELVRALGTYAGGDRAQALQIARRTNVMSERNGVANERIQAGVLLAMLLLEQGQPGKATAILGDLDAFSTTDYRVAWTTLALYRALGDADMTANALARVQALRGERDTTLEPAL